jgi:elongation factor Ts
MHIASAKPIAVAPEDIPSEIVEQERAIFDAQVAGSGKPEHVRGKIVEGKLKKSYQESALLHQAFVKDDKKTVGDLVKEISAKVGENVVVSRFVRYELGDA